MDGRLAEGADRLVTAVDDAACDDTALVTDDGVEVVIAIGDWPTDPVVSWDDDAAVRRLRGLRGDC